MNKKQRQTLEKIFEQSDRADIFHGKVINLRDVITFEGETVHELRTAFKDSVEDYLEYCAERGEDPEKPYSGKFLVRVEPELHKTLVIQARKLWFSAKL